MSAAPIRPWYARPGVVLPLVGGVMLAVAVTTPEYVLGRSGDTRLSSYNRGPQGGKLFAEFATAAGWKVVSREGPDLTGGARAVHAVLSPSVPVRQDEAHAILEAVRNGGGLLLVLDGSALALQDSLKVATAEPGIVVQADSLAVASCPATSMLVGQSLWMDDKAHLYGVRFRGPRPSGVQRLDGAITADTSSTTHALGFPYGRGRVAVIGDPDMLRNDAIRVCRFGLDLAAADALGYLARTDDGSLRSTLVLDEYHQGYGEHTSMTTGLIALVRDTPTGRGAAILCVAGLVLLLAAAPRDIEPRDDSVIERRSPLEQVDALARAYAQVSGTRTATMRLLHGVRRRTQRNLGRRRDARNDDEFLARVAHLQPARANDVARVRRALATTVPSRELPEIADALDRIEKSLTHG